MKRKVYVVFYDVQSRYTNKYENFDYYREFVNVVGTEEQARGVIEQCILEHYYDAIMEQETADKHDLALGYSEPTTKLNYELIDEDNKMMISYNDDAYIYYYEEFEIEYKTGIINLDEA